MDDEYDRQHVGREVTIVEGLESRVLNRRYTGDCEIRFLAYRIAIDGAGRYHPNGGHYIAKPEWLVPLVDPAADQFIERIKRLAKEPQPLKADELHTVRGGVA